MIRRITMKRNYMTPVAGIEKMDAADVIATSGLSVWNGDAPKFGEDRDVVDFD